MGLVSLIQALIGINKSIGVRRRDGERFGQK